MFWIVCSCNALAGCGDDDDEDEDDEIDDESGETGQPVEQLSMRSTAASESFRTAMSRHIHAHMSICTGPCA